ncbi:hypothetical protein GA0116948_11815 [Chitinophaga costaii]|uniref:Cytochrome B n=1 Tax=Chitinophaga costaii TaxID=1335309 RepID=A0A1C4FXN0_9BACT|nr:hypothetical protein [Chitinophaga costaii]PUZ20894.1 hypothetical protein DCM91_17315 [Chitinophaga costaii]SCC60616.1 hypothetical protein GA0116948_11815 [Chitinophaga costaii]
MYFFLLVLHSFMRWLVLVILVYAIFTAAQGLVKKQPFSNNANVIRHCTATIAHLQLVLGITLYFQSPAVKFLLSDSPATLVNEGTFFRYIHISLMLVAVVVITIGSSRAKRMENDPQKYKTMLTWFSIGLLLILIAIPWPFSPLAHRPFIRNF